MFEHTIGFSIPTLLEHRQQRRQVHRDEPGLGVVPGFDVVGEDPEGVLEAEAEQQVDDDVLQEDDRRAQALEHLHLGVDQQRGDALDVLLGHRRAAADRRVEQALVGQEALERAEHPVLGHRVGVLVGVRHARVEREVRVALRLGAHVVADLGDAVVRGAHERAHAGVVGGVEHVDHGVERLEAHRLRPRLLLRHVVDAEELVVAEQQAVHQDPFRVSRWPTDCRAGWATTRGSRRRRRRLACAGADAGSTSPLATVGRAALGVVGSSSRSPGRSRRRCRSR